MTATSLEGLNPTLLQEATLRAVASSVREVLTGSCPQSPVDMPAVW